MENRHDLDALLNRLSVLERRQRSWGRLAIVLCAVALLAFAGWAPFDAIETPPSKSPTTTPLAQPATPDALPTTPPSEESIESLPDTSSPEQTPPESQGNGDEVVTTHALGGFQSYTHREGDETYLPTRMEWLSLRASAELPRGGGPNDGYGIMYGPDGKGSNTIRVLCSYDAKRVNRAQMENDLKYIQMQLAGLAQLHGWDWLKVRIEARAVN